MNGNALTGHEIKIIVFHKYFFFFPFYLEIYVIIIDILNLHSINVYKIMFDIHFMSVFYHI